MTIHLDTNLLVEVGLSGSAMRASLTAWLMEGNHLAASTIAWSEFCNGSLISETREAAEISLNRKILPFDQAMAEKASLLFNATGRRRGSHSDCMIATTAIISNTPLSTLNLKDFEPFIPHGLHLHTF